ncbi:MAG: polyribonucleotide nucleotidyltransferase [Legionellales bacterium]|nr:polyribonucleotide nucleotidyltransferase [Legionellales bacterium]OUX67479.1 MAG: polyribonucleotide nucleotidyltransferase [bacterium TMED178]
MSDYLKHSFELGQKTYEIENGYFANQADGSVLVTVGDCQIFSALVWSKDFQTKNDFFPLRVDYINKYYAGGRIPGGFLKRESKPTDAEILKSRLIDRTIRPTFHKDFNQEVQITTYGLSLDPQIESDVPALLASSLTIALAGLPTKFIVAGVRVGLIDNNFVLNPTKNELEQSSLDLFVSGSKENVVMVEALSQEIEEDVMLDAIEFAKNGIKTLIEQIEFVVKKQKIQPIKLPTAVKKNPVDITKLTKDIDKAISIINKIERNQKLNEVESSILSSVDEEHHDDAKETLHNYIKTTIRNNVIKNNKRIDGRDLTTVRPIDIKIGYLKRTHGSAVFKRGETTSLSTVTLGSSERDAQIIDDANGEYRDKFLLHYNFPSFSTGECGFSGAPKRREIGHGNLAKKSFSSILPSVNDFPYTIRIVSEIFDSNGSSSMATVCASSLALMNAGVPIKEHVAGIAMGLIKDHDDFAVLTDILGDEDHLGDMDFKVSGTANGITALQMDIKIEGINRNIMHDALLQAKEGRKHILNLMNDVISTPAKEISQFAPRITTVKIHPNKIKVVIGKGGANIKEITEKYNVDIDIDDNGLIKVSSKVGTDADQACQHIVNMTTDPEVGQIYEGPITKILEFGAFVQLPIGRDGFLHISQISDEHVYDINEKLKLAQVVKVKIAEIDRQNRIKLTLKDLQTSD